MHSARVSADVEDLERMAESSRFNLNPSQAALWRTVAERWEALGRPHRGSYAKLRHAEALLDVDAVTASDSLHRAWGLAGEHRPLRDAIRSRAEQQNIDLVNRSSRSTGGRHRVTVLPSSRSWTCGPARLAVWLS